MIPYTAIAYAIGSFVFAFMVLRFYQYYSRESSVFSGMILLFALSFFAFTLYTAIASLLFADNGQALKSAVVAATFFQGLGSSFLAYLIVFMKLPLLSPRFTFLLFFGATLLTTYLVAGTPGVPVFDAAHGVVDWGTITAEHIPRVIIFFVTFIPMGYIFVQQYFSSKDPQVKLRAVGLGAPLILGAFAAAIDLVLEQQLNLGPASGDIGQIFIYSLLFFVLLFTQRPPRPQYVKEV